MAAPMRFACARTWGRFGHELATTQKNATLSPKLWKTCSQRTIFTSQRRRALFARLSCAPFAIRSVTLAAGSGLTALYTWDFWHRTASSAGLVWASEGAPPKYEPIRRVRSDTDTSGLKLTLFQYQTCPFCCKVRAYLDYHGFSYDVIEVNSVWRTQLKWTKYKKVPILVCHGMGEDGYLQLNDSSVIVSALETFLVDKTQPLDKIAKYYPSIEGKNAKGKTTIDFPNRYFIMYMDKAVDRTSEQMKEERKWRTWVDDWFVHTLSPNIYRTPAEALRSFQYFSQVGEWEKVFSTPERLTVIYVGAIAMYFVGKILKKRHSLNDDVRQSLFDACNKWTKAVGKKGKFRGGDEPDLSDLAMYGVLCAIQGCEAFEETLQKTSIKPWFYRMKREVELRGGSSN